MIALEPPGTTNIYIRNKLKIETLKNNIFNLTKNFFTNQVNHIDCIKNLGKMNHENAPFKIKYKLPHHILIQKQGD